MAFCSSFSKEMSPFASLELLLACANRSMLRQPTAISTRNVKRMQALQKGKEMDVKTKIPRTISL
jgi:hypothetical protein